MRTPPPPVCLLPACLCALTSGSAPPPDGAKIAVGMASLERQGLVMNVFGHAGNYRLALLSLAERDEIRASVHEVHRGHLVDVDGVTMTLREGAQRREVPVADGSWFINCTTHFRPIPHEPILQDGGAVCAPQFAMGFSGASAYYVTHLWYRNQLAPVASQFFRARVDVELKLRFGPHVALMVMANMALAGARLPLSIFAKFRGDLNKWLPAPPATSADAPDREQPRGDPAQGGGVLKSRYSDALLPSESPIPEHQRSTTLAVFAQPGENLLEARG